MKIRCCIASRMRGKYCIIAIPILYAVKHKMISDGERYEIVEMRSHEAVFAFEQKNRYTLNYGNIFKAPYAVNHR